MKKFLFTLLATVAVAVAQAQTTKTFPVGNFTKIDASGIYDITLVKGNSCSVTLTYDAHFADRILVSSTNGTLQLSMKEEWNPSGANNGSIKATVTIKNLDGLYMSGATKLKTTAAFSANQFTGRFSGASNASGLNLSGNDLEITVSGASSLDLIEKFTAVEIEVSGASNVKVSAENNRSEFSTSGAANLTLSGRSDQVEAEASGASSIKGSDFTTSTANVSTSGASHITLNVTKTLEAEASGASSIRYGGNPANVEKDCGKASSISKR